MNFYSYSPAEGMQYHKTGAEAKRVADDTLLAMSVTYPAPTPDEISQVTWGEVTERGTKTGDFSCALKRQDRLTYESEYPQVINGRMEDADGSLVLVSRIRETDLLYNDLVLTIATIWQQLSGKIQRFKQHTFEDVNTALALLLEKHNVERGGRDGNLQFFTFNRKFKLTIAIQKKIDFGPELQAAQAKIMAALDQMGDANTEGVADLRTIATGSFTLVDGRIRVASVLQLRAFKIKNALWNEGMQIIDNAIVVISSKKQIRLYERNEQGEYIAIPLDIAAL